MRLPASWYPLCLSARVPRGAVSAVDVGGERLAVFRGLDGQIGVVEARCRHAGADLTRGAVVARGLRCPLHARIFAADGRRLDHPDGCDQGAWTVCERAGVVFAFPGQAPGFPLPLPERGILHTRPQRTVAEVPAKLIAANAGEQTVVVQSFARTDTLDQSIGSRLQERISARETF